MENGVFTKREMGRLNRRRNFIGSSLAGGAKNRWEELFDTLFPHQLRGSSRGFKVCGTINLFVAPAAPLFGIELILLAPPWATSGS